eukprot:g19636.t1
MDYTKEMEKFKEHLPSEDAAAAFWLAKGWATVKQTNKPMLTWWRQEKGADGETTYVQTRGKQHYFKAADLRHRLTCEVSRCPNAKSTLPHGQTTLTGLLGGGFGSSGVGVGGGGGGAASSSSASKLSTARPPAMMSGAALGAGGGIDY